MVFNSQKQTDTWLRDDMLHTETHTYAHCKPSVRIALLQCFALAPKSHLLQLVFDMLMFWRLLLLVWRLLTFELTLLYLLMFMLLILSFSSPCHLFLLMSLDKPSDIICLLSLLGLCCLLSFWGVLLLSSRVDVFFLLLLKLHAVVQNDHLVFWVISTQYLILLLHPVCRAYVFLCFWCCHCFITPPSPPPPKLLQK